MQAGMRHLQRRGPLRWIAKGYEAVGGQMVILEASDFKELPLPRAKQVETVQFIDPLSVPYDPTQFT